MLSFALGSLGFLTKFDFDEHRSTLARAFRDGVVVSLRLRFECTIMRSQHRAVARSRAGSVRTGTTDDSGSSQERGGVDGGKGEDVVEDLVTELLGEESDDEHTHKPEASYDILNDVVVDRGPNASASSPNYTLGCWLSLCAQPCPRSRSSAMMSTSRRCKQMACAWQPRQVRLRTTCLPAARCVIRRTRSSC